MRVWGGSRVCLGSERAERGGWRGSMGGPGPGQERSGARRAQGAGRPGGRDPEPRSPYRSDPHTSNIPLSGFGVGLIGFAGDRRALRPSGRPRLKASETAATPEEFRDELIGIAKGVQYGSKRQRAATPPPIPGPAARDRGEG